MHIYSLLDPSLFDDDSDYYKDIYERVSELSKAIEEYNNSLRENHNSPINKNNNNNINSKGKRININSDKLEELNAPSIHRDNIIGKSSKQLSNPNIIKRTTNDNNSFSNIGEDYINGSRYHLSKNEIIDNINNTLNNALTDKEIIEKTKDKNKKIKRDNKPNNNVPISTIKTERKVQIQLTEEEYNALKVLFNSKTLKELVNINPFASIIK